MARTLLTAEQVNIECVPGSNGSQFAEIAELLAGCFACELFDAVEEIPLVLEQTRHMMESDIDPGELDRIRKIEELEHEAQRLQEQIAALRA